MSKIEEAWIALEEELKATVPAPPNGAVSSMKASTDTGQRLQVGVQWPSMERILIFSTTATALPPRNSWPRCRGLELSQSASSDDKLSLYVKLIDDNGREVFSSLAIDLAKKAVGGSEEEAAHRVLAALARWQRFLAASGRRMSDEVRRGLWGELKIFEDYMISAFGSDGAVQSWRGPSGAPQDFQFAGIAVEVKTRAARSPAVVTISGEQQLHEQPWQHLFLAHLAVDEQESAGESLPERIKKVKKLVSQSASAELFEDALMDAGWIEADSDQHASRGFVLRSCEFFRVTEGFPRLTPPMLAEGIGGLSYALSLDAAAPFRVPESDVRGALGDNYMS